MNDRKIDWKYYFPDECLDWIYIDNSTQVVAYISIL